MKAATDDRPVADPPVRVENRHGRGPIVLVCDHASNFLPAGYGTLGLAASDLERHIAWDPGAQPISRLMSSQLDAPLVASGISRLVIDCNRPMDAPDLISEISETTEIPGNRNLDAGERERRIALSHAPFHAAIEALLAERLAAGMETWLVSIHSFTPLYRNVVRPWQVGVLHDDDERLSGPLLASLRSIAGLAVGDNQPYSPEDRVYYTLERHARSRGLPCVMIELRNDEIATEEGQRLWADRLASEFRSIIPLQERMLGKAS